MTTLDDVQSLITQHYKLEIAGVKPIQSGYQVQIKDGPKVNVFNTGKCHVNGSKTELLADFTERLQEFGSGATPKGRKVFVVYGHDDRCRTDLEAMLRRWALEPILLDQLTSQGDTLIEKLERSMGDASFAVVLATPDDEGHPKGRDDERKFRARQNVVLELGMMLRGLGRKKVAVLLQQLDVGVMERPSDIDGLIYIPFTDSVADAKVQLAKEMNKQGLSIDLDKL